MLLPVTLQVQLPLLVVTLQVKLPLLVVTLQVKLLLLVVVPLLVPLQVLLLQLLLLPCLVTPEPLSVPHLSPSLLARLHLHHPLPPLPSPSESALRLPSLQSLLSSSHPSSSRLLRRQLQLPPCSAAVLKAAEVVDSLARCRPRRLPAEMTRRSPERQAGDTASMAHSAVQQHSHPSSCCSRPQQQQQARYHQRQQQQEQRWQVKVPSSPPPFKLERVRGEPLMLLPSSHCEGQSARTFFPNALATHPSSARPLPNLLRLPLLRVVAHYHRDGMANASLAGSLARPHTAQISDGVASALLLPPPRHVRGRRLQPLD